jgi:hypothetical protein
MTYRRPDEDEKGREKNLGSQNPKQRRTSLESLPEPRTDCNRGINAAIPSASDSLSSKEERVRNAKREGKGKEGGSLTRSQTRVDLPWRGTQDEADDGVTRDLDVLDGAEDVDLVVGEDDSRPGRVLDGETGSTGVTCYTTCLDANIKHTVERVGVSSEERWEL